MRYSYISAWSVVGGISLPKGSPPVEIYRSDHCRFMLTHDPDCLLADLDRGTAIGWLMLGGMDQHETTDYHAALAVELDGVKNKRREKSGGHPVLVLEAQGEVDASVDEPSSDHGAFMVTFDAFDKRAIGENYLPAIRAMKLALALESELPLRFSTLSEDSYLIDSAGKIVYSISFSMTGEISSSTNFTSDGIGRVSSRYERIQKSHDMDSVQRLFSQVAEFGKDKLKAFLFGWQAFEILIAKAFKPYDKVFCSSSLNAEQQTLREHSLQRIQDAMGNEYALNDRYSPKDKFLIVATVLFPCACGSVIREDFHVFCQIKKLRDSFSHGEEVSEDSLPVHEVVALFRKYALAHLDSSGL